MEREERWGVVFLHLGSDSGRLQSHTYTFSLVRLCQGKKAMTGGLF